MSWDVLVQNLPPVLSVGEIPADFAPTPLGLRRSEIIAAIESAVPGADVSDPSWLRLIGPEFHVEVSLGANEHVDHFAFHSTGAMAPGVVAAVLAVLGLRALDPNSDSGFFDAASAAESYARWKVYRDHAIASR